MEGYRAPSPPVSAEQKYALLALMEMHSLLSQGEFAGGQGAKNIYKQWEKLSIELNAIKGATKTGDQWKKVSSPQIIYFN